jgi:hypothetical protein
MPKKKGYTTQSSLSETLAGIVGIAWKGNEIAVPGTHRRWDMAYLDGHQTVVVEYDGDEHYRHSMKIKADREKDSLAAAQGYRVVRFPYWIQLETETLWHYFHIKAELKTPFPHGFITTRIFPASFCELGVERFKRELGELPQNIAKMVVASLADRAEEYGVEYVVPSTLTYLIAA